MNRAKAWGARGLPWLAAIAVTGLVEVFVRATGVQAFVFPPPSLVLMQLVEDRALLADHAAVTLLEAGLGLVLAAVLALGFAASAVHSRILDRLLTPLIISSQTVPVIALAPLLVLWFGYGPLPRVLVCALVAFFPLALNALQGFRATDPDLLLLLRSVNAPRRQVFRSVRVPAAAPFLAAGLRGGVTLALVGAVVAEWTGTDAGLGYLVLSANAQLLTARTFAAVLVITMLGLAAYWLTGVVERRVVWWRHTALR
jgi:ABC-type nitrate/sulfonate/bicarbonate transport system permease component